MVEELAPFAAAVEMPACFPGRAGQDTHEVLAQEARFVFKGTVQKLKAATIREVSADQGPAIVRVDEVIHAPEILSQYAAQNITVLMTGKKKLKKGQQSVFYTNGVMFGDSVAVEALDFHDLDKELAKTLVQMDEEFKKLGAA